MHQLKGASNFLRYMETGDFNVLKKDNEQFLERIEKKNYEKMRVRIQQNNRNEERNKKNELKMEKKLEMKIKKLKSLNENTFKNMDN